MRETRSRPIVVARQHLLTTSKGQKTFLLPFADSVTVASGWHQCGPAVWESAGQ